MIVKDAKMIITWSDGTKQEIVTDVSWDLALGASVSAIELIQTVQLATPIHFVLEGDWTLGDKKSIRGGIK